MSTPAAAGPADAKDVDRRKSLGKYVKRMSSVFKRDKATRSRSSASLTPPAPSTPAPVVEQSKEAAPAYVPHRAPHASVFLLY